MKHHNIKVQMAHKMKDQGGIGSPSGETMQDMGGNIPKKKSEYRGLKGEYSKTKQGNWMKVHPLDRN